MSRRELETRSDEQLAHLAASRSATQDGRLAASTLLKRYRERTYVWCYRYVREHESALDLAQEVLLKAYRRLGTYREGSRFGTWIFVIARNHCISSLRSPSLLIDEDVELGHLRDEAKLADETLEQQQDEESLLQLIEETLDEQEQQALSLRCFEKMPVDEIGRLLNIRGASGARGLLQTARRKLRARWSPVASSGAPMAIRGRRDGMIEGCIRPEELGDYEQLPADHPRRRHAASCPRCRSLMLNRESYLGELPDGADEAPAGAEIEDANRHLTAALMREIHGTQDSLENAESPRQNWWRRLALGPIPAPVWSVALILLVLGGVFRDRLPFTIGPEESTLRDDATVSIEPLLDTPQLLDSGLLRFSWTESPTATAYELRLYSTELNELWKSGPLTSTELLLSPGDVLETALSGQPLLWRVDASLNGDWIASSSVGSFKAP